MGTSRKMNTIREFSYHQHNYATINESPQSTNETTTEIIKIDKIIKAKTHSTPLLNKPVTKNQIVIIKN
jgi:hypothetical protein